MTAATTLGGCFLVELAAPVALAAIICVARFRVPVTSSSRRMRFERRGRPRLARRRGGASKGIWPFRLFVGHDDPPFKSGNQPATTSLPVINYRRERDFDLRADCRHLIFAIDVRFNVFFKNPGRGR
jgi:hypothetical protein